MAARKRGGASTAEVFDADPVQEFDPAAPGEYRVIPLANINDPGDNVRSSLGDLTALAESIRAVGVLQPVTVVANGTPDTFNLVAGFRRHAAAKLAGLAEIPALVRTFDPRQATEANIIENLQREDITPVDEARGFQKLADLGLSQRTIAARLGTSQSNVAKRIGLLRLGEPLLRLVDSGRIGLQTAQEDLPKLLAEPDALEAVSAALTKDDAEMSKREAKGEERHYWADLRRTVQTAIEDVTAQRQYASDLAKLKEAGTAEVKLVKSSNGYGGPELPKGTYPVRPDAYETRGVVKMTIEAHAKHPCHRFYQRPGQYGSKVPSIGYACVNPASHKQAPAKLEKLQEKIKSGKATEAEKQQAASAKASRLTRERNKQIRASEAPRAEAISAAVSRRPNREAASELIHTVAICNADSRMVRDAAETLGVKLSHLSEAKEGLLKWASESPEKLLRAATAVSLAQAHSLIIAQSAYGENGTVIRAGLSFLAATGYKVSAIEASNFRWKAGPGHTDSKALVNTLPDDDEQEQASEEETSEPTPDPEPAKAEETASTVLDAETIGTTIDALTGLVESTDDAFALSKARGWIEEATAAAEGFKPKPRKLLVRLSDLDKAILAKLDAMDEEATGDGNAE